MPDGRPINVSDIITKCTDLKKFWTKRNAKFQEWYDILLLTDEMKEDNMESFVSNRPRTFFNLSLHLINSPVIPHRYPVEGLAPEEIENTSKMEAVVKSLWKFVNRSYKKMGQQSATRLLASHILAMGWYAVYMSIDADEPHLEVWHPADVFPNFSDEGLMEVAHIYTIPDKVAKKMFKNAGLPVGYQKQGDVTIYDYWYIDEDGDVSHAIVTSNNKWFLAPHKRDDLDYIPVLVGPVGGLPDMGQLDPNWQEHCGESLVAVNESLYKNYNRMKSFLQQATRDGTEPKWFERSTGTEILSEEGMRVSGSIFRGGPQDSVDALQYPPIPVELTQNIFSYDQEIQEGSFSSLMFGSVQVQIAAFTLSQMAQSAQQVLRPYHETFQDILSCVDNFWIDQMSRYQYKPLDLTLPRIPKNDIEVEYPIAIPGDLINRATIAKMLSPDLAFSSETVMDMLFPAEVSNPLAETARSRANRAMNSELSIMIDQAVAFKTAAIRAETDGQEFMAQLYNSGADAIQYQVEKMGKPEQAPQAPPPGPPMGAQGAPSGAPMQAEQVATPMTPPGVANA